MNDSLYTRLFRDPAVVKPVRPAAKPLRPVAHDDLFPPMEREPIVQSPFVRRALEGKLPAKEVK